MCEGVDVGARCEMKRLICFIWRLQHYPNGNLMGMFVCIPIMMIMCVCVYRYSYAGSACNDSNAALHVLLKFEFRL